MDEPLYSACQLKLHGRSYCLLDLPGEGRGHNVPARGHARGQVSSLQGATNVYHWHKPWSIFLHIVDGGVKQ